MTPWLCKKVQQALQRVPSPSLSVCPRSWQSCGHHVFVSKLFPARFLTPALTGLQRPLTLPTAETGAGHTSQEVPGQALKTAGRQAMVISSSSPVPSLGDLPQQQEDS